MGSEINIFLTHYGFPMNINGLGLDLQSLFLRNTRANP